MDAGRHGRWHYLAERGLGRCERMGKVGCMDREPADQKVPLSACFES